MAFRPTVCIDFDGVVHSYHQGWRNGVIYGTVVPGFWEWARKAHEAGLELVIYSSRSKDPTAREIMKAWLIQQWTACGAHFWVAENFTVGRPDPLKFNYTTGGDVAFELTIAHEKPAAWITIDDRAVRFDGDWKAVELQPQVLKGFKPWNAKTD